MKPASTSTKPKVGALPQLDVGEDAVSGYLSAPAPAPAPSIAGASAVRLSGEQGEKDKARPRFNLALTDGELEALKTIAKKESRTTSAQAAHFVRLALRETADVRRSFNVD